MSRVLESEKLLLPKFVDFRDYTLFNPNLKVKTRDVSKGGLKKIVLHSTDASGWTPDRLSRFFVDERGFPCCAYHYYISDVVYYMVGENIVTYHASGYNSSSIGVALDYHATFNERVGIPLDKNVRELAVELIAFLLIKHRIEPSFLRGHRELFGTGYLVNKSEGVLLKKICPGMTVNLDVFRYDVIRKVQSTLNSVSGSKLAVDGIFGPKTKAALLG